ncbi:MAG TPA: hypothetical protein PKA44_09935, partial [Saprospiraceae bacterium]|nr:hypothetical protein [Saprospiraceae bacterium]
MKTFSRLLAAMLLLCLSGKAFTQNIGTIIHHRLRYISPYAQSGLLADRSQGNLDPKTFSADSLTNDNAVDASRFSGLYFTMVTTPVAEQYLLPDAKDIYVERASWRYPSDQMPLALMAFRYDYIRPDALSAGLITLSSDSTLIPTVPVDQILRQDTLFAIGPHHDIVRSNKLTLYFPAIAKNLSAAIDTLWIDNGNGWQSMTTAQPVTLGFTSGGLQFIKTKIKVGNKELHSHFVVDIQYNFSNSNPPQPEGRYDQANPRIVDIEAEDAYLGEKATSKLYIFTHCDDDIIRKPLIIVDGFEPSAKVFDKTTHELQNSNAFKNIFDDNKLGIFTTIPENISYIPSHQALYDAGYDLIFVDYTDRGYWSPDENGVRRFKTLQRGGQDYVQRNALMLETAIKFVNDEMKAHDPNSKINLVGMSMGGVVCKWAVLDMEERGIDHNIENFWSFDSPHRGANIPAGLQALVHDLYNLAVDFGYGLKKKVRDEKPEIVEAYSVLTSHFAESSLIYNLTDIFERTKYNAFQNEYMAKGRNHDGEIMDCHYRAISNGALDGTGQIFNAGDPIALIDTRAPYVLKHLGGSVWWNTFWNDFQYNFGSGISLFCNVISQRSNGLSTIYVRSLQKKILGMMIPPQQAIILVPSFGALDNCAGGFTVLGDDINGINWIQDGYSFTPVGSALDVRGDILDFLDFDFSNVENIIDQNLVRPESYTGAVEPVVSFSIREDGGHRTFPLQLNQLHVFTTYRSIAFLAYDLLSFSGLTLSELDHQTFNFGKLSSELEPNYELTMFQPRNGNISQSILVKNNSTIGINMGGQLGLNPGSNLPNNLHPSEFTVNIVAAGCEDSPTIVSVDNSSKIQVGDETVANKGLLNIGYNATLDLSGTLDVRPESKITILNGGTLIIRTGALLNMDSAQIIVEDGGHLIIEDDPKLKLWAGSKIIIRGVADFGKITCDYVNAEIHLPTGGRLNLHGDFNYTGYNASQLLFNVGANSAVYCDSINLTLSQGKITGGMNSVSFLFKNGAKSVKLTDLDFEGGTGIDITSGLDSLDILRSTFTGMSMGARINLAPDVDANVTISKSKFLIGSGVYANNVKYMSVTESEFIGRSWFFQYIWDAKKVGLQVDNGTQLNINQSFFALLQYGIKTSNTPTYLSCSYSINNIYGIEHFNAFNTSKTLKMVQSGLIKNRIGALVNNTNFDINIDNQSTIDANLFVHCNGTSYPVPERFSKPEEINPYYTGGGIEGDTQRDAPYLPTCGAFFQGTVSPFNVIDFELLAKNNIWVCNTPLGYCNWTDLKDNSSNHIDLLRDPQMALDGNKDIEFCAMVLYQRENKGEAKTESDPEVYSIYPNPTGEFVNL